MLRRRNYAKGLQGPNRNSEVRFVVPGWCRDVVCR